MREEFHLFRNCATTTPTTKKWSKGHILMTFCQFERINFRVRKDSE